MPREIALHMRGGVITERDPQFCTIRTRIPAGMVNSQMLRGLADIAEKFSAPGLHLTTRQTIEIPGIDSRNLQEIAAELDRNGTPIGSERDEVVNVTACPGLPRCVFANIDSMNLAKAIDNRLFGREMPVKIRISISACPNACTSPMLNEIGIIGRISPIRTPGLCTGCGTCVEYCKEGAISIKKGVSVLDPALCVQCGTCIRSCPFALLKSSGEHYMISVGGRRGRHPRIGRELVVVRTPEAVVDVVEKVVQWVYRRAWSGRLLSEQLEDIRFGQLRDEIRNMLPASVLFEDV
ncbi:MAG TPA: 4Fe-4S binding protein [Methanolinea sp.]|jgi:dissimilatory sulfite reductase (desulfoviridin) alpha/beta subunit|nr:4Fe-4S binding protein [Methanolinea sp.]HPC55146.1 4Fe-4S binding protein [Methanolinea sp.]HQE85910.1 4Fe-4S binding protein [Methanolinea sp.]HQI14675.1 4Fe-4S binding protein [Methanolinea sp.]HQJ18962.1 4Fe-4S binding protein [Methanolinea sp.]